MQQLKPLPPSAVSGITALSLALLAAGIVGTCYAVSELFSSRSQNIARQRQDAQEQAELDSRVQARESRIKAGERHTTTIRLDVDGCTMPTFDSDHMSFGNSHEVFKIVHPDGLDLIRVANTENLFLGNYSLTEKKMMSYTPPITCAD